MVFVNIYSILRLIQLLQVTSNYISTYFHSTFSKKKKKIIVPKICKNGMNVKNCKNFHLSKNSFMFMYMFLCMCFFLFFFLFFGIHNALQHQRLLSLTFTKYFPLLEKKIQSKEESLVTFFFQKFNTNIFGFEIKVFNILIYVYNIVRKHKHISKDF